MNQDVLSEFLSQFKGQTITEDLILSLQKLQENDKDRLQETPTDKNDGLQSISQNSRNIDIDISSPKNTDENKSKTNNKHNIIENFNSLDSDFAIAQKYALLEKESKKESIQNNIDLNKPSITTYIDDDIDSSDDEDYNEYLNKMSERHNFTLIEEDSEDDGDDVIGGKDINKGMEDKNQNNEKIHKDDMNEAMGELNVNESIEENNYTQSTEIIKFSPNNELCIHNNISPQILATLNSDESIPTIDISGGKADEQIVKIGQIQQCQFPREPLIFTIDISNAHIAIKDKQSLNNSIDIGTIVFNEDGDKIGNIVDIFGTKEFTMGLCVKVREGDQIDGEKDNHLSDEISLSNGQFVYAIL